jgi:hypothetical protein
MHDFMDEFQMYFFGHDWVLREETLLPPATRPPLRVEWIVESLTPPIGRRVQIGFRVLGYSDYYDEYQFNVVVRSSDWPEGPSPQEEFDRYQAQANGFRQLFRVMEWFRDPWSPLLWRNPWSGDWFPPGHWNPEALRLLLRPNEEWETCRDPERMLPSLRGSTSERKLRLLACGLCRLLPLAMLYERNRHAVAVAERFAEEACPRRELKKACKASDLPWLLHREPFSAVQQSLAALKREGLPEHAARAADLIRDVVCNPYHRVTLRKQWLKSNEAAVQQIARSIAADRAFEQLPILADALEDGGCTDEAILGHCRRGGGDHIPGCWVLDLILGRN